MTFILLGFLFLYLSDNKKIKVVLCCLLPVVLILPAFFRPDSGYSMEMVAFYAGMLCICFSPIMEKIFSRVRLPERRQVSGTSGMEDDILDNKKKWHLIVAGYIIFVLFAIFACVAIFRLNAKINSMYEITQDLKQQIEMQDGTQDTPDDGAVSTAASE